MKKLDWNIWSKNPKDYLGQELQDGIGNKWVIDDSCGYFKLYKNGKNPLEIHNITELIFVLNSNEIQTV